jgi:pimeloyl-ACP methyl ester carboxylesterase
MRLLYLHGFASSPDSSKARFFADRLRQSGLCLERPDFNEPDFSTLTISRMIAQVERSIAGASERMVLIGSSMGGLVAWHVAARAEARGHELDRLVLLAPAFDFGANRLRDLGPDNMARWRETGWLEFFHYLHGEPRRVHYALYEDAARYDSFKTGARVPTLIFQGSRDASVDPAMVERFAASHRNVTLRLLDDDHQLHASLETIWLEMAGFLGLAPQRA